MKLFLDTADMSQIREAIRWGIVDGVTTNPALVSRTGRPAEELYAEICATVPGPVSLECVSMDADGIVAEARRLAAISGNAVIKVPAMREGLVAVKRLAEEGIKTNVTLICSTMQAFLAAKVGATYVSPFVGRLDLMGQEGMETIRQIKTIYDNYRFTTEIIVASARHPKHVLESALAGAHICTIPIDVMELLYQHPMTDVGIQQFLAAWAKVPQERKPAPVAPATGA
ncbi:MAG: fructose-6-phosphate aldolase [Verrucomicrobiae bacterium]|nr:fructose-6-phosphate aldolase [Verrucomicrobiae bacterium]